MVLGFQEFLLARISTPDRCEDDHRIDERERGEIFAHRISFPKIETKNPTHPLGHQHEKKVKLFVLLHNIRKTPTTIYIFGVAVAFHSSLKG